MGDRTWRRLLGATNFKRQTITNLLDAGTDINQLDCSGQTMLSTATEVGNQDAVEFLAERGASAFKSNSDGSRPFHIAAYYGHTFLVQWFLDRGISVDIHDDDNRTPLHYVTAKRKISIAEHQKIIHILVDHHADINAVDRDGSTPMLLAAWNSHQNLVEEFIALGANLECCDDRHISVLYYACQKGWTEIVQLYVERRFEIDLKLGTSTGLAPEFVAARYYHQGIVKLLVEIGTDAKVIDYWNRTLLHFACQNGWLEVVQILVCKGCDLNVKNNEGRTPVYMAASNSRSDVVEYLLESKNVKVYDDGGWTLLDYACREGWLEVVKYFMTRGCDINAKSFGGKRLLFLAAYKSRLRVIAYLVECVKDVKGCDDNGWTLLHYACGEGWFDVVKSLLSKGCELNSKDSLGVTPLLRAARSGHCSIVAHLIGCGADVDYHEVGWTALHYACQLDETGGWLQVVQLLTKKVSDINVQTFSRSTPLHLAAEKYNLKTIEHLLNAGADCCMENVRGKTALNMFIQDSFDFCPLKLNIIILFLQKGAYFQTDDCVKVHKNKLLKKGILQNPHLCTMALINKINNGDLCKIYKIPGVSGTLPSIEEFKIGRDASTSLNFITHEISESVKFEIETKGRCNLLKRLPICLRLLSINSIIQHSILNRKVCYKL